MIISQSYCDFLPFYDLIIDNKVLHCGCVYRPPNIYPQLFLDTFSAILNTNKLSKSKFNIWIGDFNFNLFKHESLKLTGDFLSLMLTNSYLPLIMYPTRIAEFSEKKI